MSSGPTKHLTEFEAKSLGRTWVLNFKRETKKFKKCGLYVIEFEKGVKIGISNNVQRRLEAFLGHDLGEIKNIVMYSTPQPRRLELKVIEKFKDYAIDNTQEFFSGISLKQLIKFIESDRYFKRR